jgi:c(7)-type cytochrome triheme protein
MDELRSRGGRGRWILLAPLLVVPCPALAASTGGRAIELKLPADIVYERVVGADSAVTFSHGTHVAFAGEKCTGCHPRPFRMLTPERRANHRAMNAGQSCGSCHDGRQAFAVSDAKSCGSCHAGKTAVRTAAAEAAGKPATPPGRKLPKPVAYARGEASPGRVTFRHETHVAKSACAACHPKPFAMKAAGTRPGGGMHEAASCGACHDGAKSFGVEDADACARCHVAEGSP